MRLPPSRACFAATMIGLGILCLVQRDFPPIWSGVYKGLPARAVVLYLCALVSIATGVGLLVQRTTVLAARVLLIYLLAWLVVFRIPQAFAHPTVEATWWECGDTAVMASAAWILYSDKHMRIARAFYGLGLLPFGIAHFVYLKNTVDDVPAWLPWHVAWAYFTGAAFIAAGLAILSGRYARLAAALSALMMALFTLLVWVPVLVTGPSAFQWAEFVNSWSLTAAAWVVADSYRSMAWRKPELAPQAVTDSL